MLHLLDMPGIARLYNHHVSSTVMAAEQPLFSLQEISQFPGFFQSVSLTLHGSGWNSCQGVTISRRCNATAVAVVSHRAPSLQGTKGSAAPTGSLQLCLPCPNQTVWSSLKPQELLLVAGMYLQESRICCECKSVSPNTSLLLKTISSHGDQNQQKFLKNESILKCSH